MRVFVSILLFLAIIPLKGQEVVKSNRIDTGFSEIPQENAFVHFNTSLLFPAEYLYYTVYCINTKTNQLSSLSKIIYVELVGENLEPVFRHKIRLNGGVGQGDFFVPVSVLSGNYKLIAYTNWMKNRGVDYFFQQDISVINPYQGNQETILPKMSKQVVAISDTLTIKREDSNDQFYESHQNTGPVRLLIQKKQFGKREKVTVDLNTIDNKFLEANLSISVRQKSPLPQFPHSTYDKVIIRNDHQLPEDSTTKNPALFLPELRGELITGSIASNTNELSVANKKLAISFPGENHQFKIVKTNDKGRFFVNIGEEYSSEIITLQLLGENRESYKIELDGQPPLDYSAIDFEKYLINESMERSIQDRSIHNQIESAFFRFKPDSIVNVQRTLPFNSINGKYYDMNDYTDFKSVKEAIVEVIKDVWVNKGKNDNETIEINSMDLKSDPAFLPMVIVDGLIVQNHTAVLEYDARNINTVQVYRDKYIFGSEMYKGVIIFETKSTNFDQYYNDSSQVQFKVYKPQVRKKYYNQLYDNGSVLKEPNLPDDRLQLFWKPDLKFNDKSTDISFFTSDIIGEFEISVKGLTKDGLPISIKESFFVN